MISTRWSGQDPEPALAALPAALPEGEVRRLAGGGPFGWLVFARLDDVAGRLALEVLEDSRMAGPDHYRVWEDGTVEPLPTERTAYALPRDATPEERARILAEFHAHNAAVQRELAKRGFQRG